MDVKVLWSTRDWAGAVAELAAPGPLPCRTVLVPRERVAHGLRRELLRMGRGAALAGARFVTPATAALEVLRAAGISCEPGEETLRRARVPAILGAGVPLEHFPLPLLTSRPGWAEALARTVGDLEAGDLTPADLDGDEADGRMRDVAAIWRGLDRSAGISWTIQRIYREARQVLQREPHRWPYPGAALAVATGITTVAQARFFRAIPGVTLGFLAARPLVPHHLERVAALLGDGAARAVGAAVAPRSSASERDLLASYLFEPPELLAEPGRPRSRGPDGTVELSDHAGVEAEVEAAADWVAGEIAAGTPLEGIAVLMPGLHPVAGLVAERLARLPWPGGPLPVHVAGGLPLAGTAAGARVIAVVRALRAHLSGEALAAVLPALRTVPAESRHLAHGAATDLVWSLGTVGGDPAHPEGALEWASRLARRDTDNATQLERARGAADDADRSGLARKARDLERLLADLRAVRPAVEALVDVARLVAGRVSLADLWPTLREFLERWVLQPGEGPRVPAVLDARLSRAARDPACRGLAGDEALALVEDTALGNRLPPARFGEPAVYVGTLAGAVGLRFTATRVIGLAEGHLPSSPREDPVLPDAVRQRLRAREGAGAAVGPITRADVTLAALHALDQVVRDAEARVALSAPRLDTDRSLREPSSVILEAAAALARPSAASGAPSPGIPDRAALHRDAFRPARRAAVERRRAMPVAAWAWQDGVALGAIGTPSRWRGGGALDLDRIAALLASEDAGALDGILGPRAAAGLVPGLTPAWPISASGLQKLLQCPHQFLLGAVLGFEEPAAAPPQREIGQPAYGALVHLAAQELYQAHGPSFCAREGDLETWLKRAEQVGERVFEQFLEQYPLAGGAVRGQQRNRFLRDLQDLVRHDRKAAGRRFVAVERAFGRPEPVALPAGARWLYLRGQIDRIDADPDRTIIRDFKTGRPQPRTGKAAAPDPVVDVQIAVYGLVARTLASAWQVPPTIGAAYAYVNRGVEERDWREDFHRTLEPAAVEWLAVAAALLEARAFPRTPRSEDCKYCAFRSVCGEHPHERAARVLARGGAPLLAFAAMKTPSDGEGGPSPAGS